MDSDSSLDGDFETKHEIAAQSRRDDELAAAMSTKSDMGDGSGDESVESVDGDRDFSPIRSPLPVDRDSSPVMSPAPIDRGCSLIHSPPPTEKGELSPKSNNELSDSESDNISSASSVASNGHPSSPPAVPGQEDEGSNVEEQVKEENGPSSLVENKKVSDKLVKKDEIPGHGEDLSDVSDLDSNDGRDSLDVVSEEEGGKKVSLQGEWKGGVSSTAAVEEMEQLDFEAEEQADKEEKEEGECEGGGDKSEDDGELKGDDLEEGELTDEDENRPEETEPRPVCRFYNRGQCTWGSSCR